MPKDNAALNFFAQARSQLGKGSGMNFLFSSKVISSFQFSDELLHPKYTSATIFFPLKRGDNFDQLLCREDNSAMNLLPNQGDNFVTINL